MEWTNEDREQLLLYKKQPDEDDVRFKEIIKEKLLNNKLIVHVLHNKEIEESEGTPDDYFGINILPYYLITPTQTNVENFICYEIGFNRQSNANRIIKYGRITFYILCDQKNIIDEDTGIARHDLLAALIKREFNWSNCFGKVVKCVSDVSSVVDNDYACRTIIYEGEFPNDIAQTQKNGAMEIINSSVRR